MAELLPEFRNSPKEESSETHRRSPRRARQVTDIHTWVQCFATYAGVLAGRHPEAIAELMASLICLVRVSRDFQGVAWVRYDAAFRRQAAITGNRQWSKINPTLYSLCFAGRAQTVSRCELCMDTSHVTKDCALFTDPDPELPNRVKAIENAVLALTRNDTPRPGATVRAQPEPCRLWNSNRCTFPRCRYRHVCRVCGGDHLALNCTSQGAAHIASSSVLGPMRGVGASACDAAKTY